MCMTCVSGFFVDFKADDMLSAKSAVASPVFPRPSAYMYTDCELQSVLGSQRSPSSTSSPPPLRKNKVSLEGQRVYRARQALTDLILTGKGKTFGREVCGISPSQRKQRVCVGVEILSQESLLIWQSRSGKGSCFLSDLGLCDCVVLCFYMYQYCTSLPRKCEEHTIILGRRYFTLKTQSSYFSF